MGRDRNKLRLSLLIACCLLAGCGKLKQWAYQGVGSDQWQQPEKVIATLKLRPGDQIADLGAGGGYFTFKLAQAVGAAGKVYAVDIDQQMIDLLADRARKDGIANVETILANVDDPLLPKSGVDLIFTCDTFHHIDNRVSYFKNLQKYLKPVGPVAVIDFYRLAWIEGLLRHYTPSEFIKREMEQAGFALQVENEFLDRQSFMIFAPDKARQN